MVQFYRETPFSSLGNRQIKYDDKIFEVNLAICIHINKNTIGLKAKYIKNHEIIHNNFSSSNSKFFKRLKRMTQISVKAKHKNELLLTNHKPRRERHIITWRSLHDF